PLRARLPLLWIPIRVPSVAQGSLASLLSGTSVRSVAKEQARAGVPHFLAKPKVRPLPTELQNAPRVAIQGRGLGSGNRNSEVLVQRVGGIVDRAQEFDPGRWLSFGLYPALGLPSSLTRLL